MESVSNEANRGICESLLEISKTYSKNGEQYRAKALNHSAHQLAKVHIVIDKSNINTLKLIPGVGMGTVARVHEYITKNNKSVKRSITGLALPDPDPKKAKTYHYPQPQEAVIYNKDNYLIIESNKFMDYDRKIK